MKKGRFFILFVLILVLATSSCVSHQRVKKYRKSKKIAWVKTTQYVIDGYRDFPDSTTQRKTYIGLSNTDYMSFGPGDTSISKEVGYYHPDSTVSSLSFMAYSNTSSNYFDINWERDGIQEGNNLFYFEHHSFDYETQVEYSAYYSNNDKQANLNKTVVLEHYGNDNHFTRTYKIPDEVLTYYKAVATKYKDSVDFVEVPEVPDLSSCTELLSSNSSFTEYLSEDSSISRTTTVDSNLVNGKIQINKTIRDSYQSKTVDSTGLITEIYNNPQGDKQIYWELHYRKRNQPIYQLNYQVNALRTDTIYKMEMTSQVYTDSSQYHFIISGAPIKTQNNTYGETDYRIPITKREVIIWRDKKWNARKVHVHAYSNQGHHLEYLYTQNKKGTLTPEIDKRTIPQVSGNAVYDVYGPYYYNFNLIHNTPTGFKRKYYRSFGLGIFKKKQSNEFFGKRTKKLEKDRKNKYEKRVSVNSYEKKIFEIYYR